MHVHTLRKKNHGKLDGVDGFVRISESASTSTFFHQVSRLVSVRYWTDQVHKRWSQLGGQIVETAQNITAVEKETFKILRAEVCYPLRYWPYANSTPDQCAFDGNSTERSHHGRVGRNPRLC